MLQEVSFNYQLALRSSYTGATAVYATVCLRALPAFSDTAQALCKLIYLLLFRELLAPVFVGLQPVLLAISGWRLHAQYQAC